jgi:internalin A
VTTIELLALIDQAKQEQWTELDLSGQYLSELPPEIGELSELQVLKLGYNQKTRCNNYLTALPETVAQLTNLRALDLGGNNLGSLPVWIGQLTNLQSLDLSYNHLDTLPESWSELTNLQSLILTGNNLDYLPVWLIDLANLQTLDLSYNNFTVLPVWLGRLTNLRTLAVSFNRLAALPARLNQLAQLKSLAASGNQLELLPAWLAQLTGLEALDLGGNKLDTLPGWLGLLTHLRALDLSYNNLSALPEELGQLAELRSLCLGFNNLSELPDSLGRLTNLQSLDLSSLKFSDLPEWLAQLTSLQALNLARNNLSSLPEWLGELSQLQALDLSNNELSVLPAWLAQLTDLQSLDLGGNKLTELPEWLARMTSLQALDLGGNRLTELPDWLVKLTNLQSLDLGGSKLTRLPKWLAELTNLQTLDLSYNSLPSLPAFVGDLTQLQSLDLKYNKLRALPKRLTQLADLQSLDLSGNRFNVLPVWLAQLRNLQSLNVRYNRLTALPEEMAQLTGLQTLDLSGNKIKALSGWLVDLPALQWLHLFQNPIVDPSPELLGDALTKEQALADLPALRRYYEQIRKMGTAAFYEAKLLIIGEGGAGKTSLARKLQDPTTPLSPDEDSTAGIEVANWQFPLPPDSPEKEYRVNIWDFGGQEVYFATHQFFLTRRSVYVLVADTRQQHTDFYTWLRMQETFGGDSPVVLLKNRNRRQGSRFTIENLPQLRERFANLKDVIELDLDNVPADENWNFFVRELEDHFLRLEHVGKPRPRTWVAVREALQEDTRDTISRQDFLGICAVHDIYDEADALQLSDYLHNLGDILHFQNDAILADIVILQPSWGLDAVYRVLDNEKVVENWGKFSLDDLRILWHESKYDGHHHQLLRLMQNFQLCYPLPDQPDTYIAPQLLKPDVPDYRWHSDNNLQLRYRYPIFMPRGILSRAIVKLHARIEDQVLVWRSGVILNDGYARAEILELRGDGEIRIRVAGRNKRDLLMEIVRALDELHRSFPKLHYEQLIPCNCPTCAPLIQPHFFDLKELRDRLANDKDTIECKNSPYANVSIRGLMDDLDWTADSKKVDPFGREIIYHIAGDYYAGDRIGVRDISGGAAVAIGAQPQATTTSITHEEGIMSSQDKPTPPPVKSAWRNGLFYLLVFVVVFTVMALVGFIANYVSYAVLLTVLTAAFLAVVLVSVLQLRMDGNLTQEHFMELIRLLLGKLPFVGPLMLPGDSSRADKA